MYVFLTMLLTKTPSFCPTIEKNKKNQALLEHLFYCQEKTPMLMAISILNLVVQKCLHWSSRASANNRLFIQNWQQRDNFQPITAIFLFFILYISLSISRFIHLSIYLFMYIYLNLPIIYLYLYAHHSQKLQIS